MPSRRFSEHFDTVDQVFRPSERSRLVYEILLRCPYRSPEPLATGKNSNSFSSSLIQCRNVRSRRMSLSNMIIFLDRLLVMLFEDGM